MKETELLKKLEEFLASSGEAEWLEFKEAKRSFNFDDMGKYFSALSNEANLKGKESAWLVFGVKDKPRSVVGTDFRTHRASLDNLKHEIAKQTTNNITFEEIYELHTADGHRVIMYQIPAALRGIPTAWKGHWYGGDGESLVPLGIGELEKIRGQAIRED